MTMILSTSFAKKLKNFFRDSFFNKTYIIDSILKKNISSAIVSHSNGFVLDLGCGEMPYRELIERNAKRYFALEYPGAANFFDEKIDKVDVYGDAQVIPFAKNVFDTVFSTEVLEHVPRSSAMLSESFRILKEGGILIMTVPYCYKIHMEPHDYFRFTKYGLTHLLDNVGFQILDMKSNGGSLAAIGQSFSNYLYEEFILDPSTNQPKSVLRLALILPFCAFWQGIFLLGERFSKVDSLSLGYTVVAQKPRRKGTEKPIAKNGVTPDLS